MIKSVSSILKEALKEETVEMVSYRIHNFETSLKFFTESVPVYERCLVENEFRVKYLSEIGNHSRSLLEFVAILKRLVEQEKRT
jgi:hypothetical protein